MEFVFETEDTAKRNEPEILSASSQDYGRQSDFLSMGASPRRGRSASAGRRNLPKSFNDIEFNETPKRSRARRPGPKVKYVKPMKKKARSRSKFEWTWNKLAWIACSLLVVRLFFMDSGIIDYHQMNESLLKKEQDLHLLRKENAELIREINLIKTSLGYQKKLTREHLGVIAKDEYLVLFAKDSY